MGKLVLNSICSTTDDNYADRNDVEVLVINSKKDCFREIGQRSFIRCTQLRSVNMSAAKNLEIIKTSAFAFCSALRSVSLPKSLYAICEEAFLECIKLEKVVFPKDSQLSIFGQKCFMSCISLRSLYIPPKVTEISVCAFSNTTSLASIKSDSPKFIVINGVLYTDNIKAIVIYPTACKNTSYVLPEGITEIFQYTFANSLFKTFTFNHEIDSISCGAFINSSVDRVVISTNTHVTIGNYSFTNSNNLVFVDLRATKVTHIYEYAFAFCRKLKEILLPKEITSIQASAFRECFSLKIFDVLDNCQLELIYDEAFMGSGLKNFHISEKLNFIGTSAFANSLITNITVSPHNQYYIFENKTLYGESGRSITFFIGWRQKVFTSTRKVVLLRTRCFFGAVNLEEIILPDTVEYIMNDAISCTSIKVMIIPSSVKQLGERCLAFNRFLKYVEISQKIIPKSCLEGCVNLRCINIPDVQFIRGDAFKGCNKVECVYANQKLVSQCKKFFPSRVFNNKVCCFHNNPITIV